MEGNIKQARWRTHEEVVCVGYIAADAEELHEIMELAVDVAAYLQRGQWGGGERGLGRRTVTGAVTVTTLPSSMRSSRARWQSSRTCGSGMGRQARSCAMALQRASAGERATAVEEEDEHRGRGRMMGGEGEERRGRDLSRSLMP